MAENAFDTDVIVVGASLAGSSLALHLAQSGIRSILIDRSQFPRRKACGEGLSMRGLRSLEALGLREKVLALAHQSYCGYRIWNSYGTTEFGVSKIKESRGIGIQRLLLDQLVLSAALLSGAVEGIFGETVRDFRETSGGFEVRIKACLVRARHLVLADGANSSLRRKLAVPLRRKASNRIAWSMSLAGQGFTRTLELINIFLADGFEVYCTALGENRLNVSILADDRAKQTALRQHNRLSQILQEIKQALKYEGELTDAPLGMAGFGAVTQKSCWEGVLLVGDCAESFDPIGGMGMTHALESSALAAEALTEVLKEGKDPVPEFDAYHAKRDAAARPLRAFTRMVHTSLGRLGRSGVFLRLGKLPVSSTVIEQLLYRDQSTSPSLAARLLENMWGS
jgi:menaquinone-9 beta-reductase